MNIISVEWRQKGLRKERGWEAAFPGAEGFEGPSCRSWVCAWGQGWERGGGSRGWVCQPPGLSLNLHVVLGVKLKWSLEKSWESPGKLHGVLKTGSCLLSRSVS